jgi:hypothetical protein
MHVENPGSIAPKFILIRISKSRAVADVVIYSEAFRIQRVEKAHGLEGRQISFKSDSHPLIPEKTALFLQKTQKDLLLTPVGQPPTIHQRYYQQGDWQGGASPDYCQKIIL